MRILAVNVGNTRTTLGVFDGRELESANASPNADAKSLADAVVEAAAALEDAERAAVAVASVNPPLSRAMLTDAAPRLEHDVLIIGDDIPLPVAHTLGEAPTTGHDRFLNALAAFDVVKQACVIIDAGTAITVDFVDGEGTFHGGAIAPGARMMFRALHEQTAALPDIDAAWPQEDAPFPQTTADAMRAGVCYGARGMVRMLAERCAESYGAYPQIIATGGDAELLFRGDDLIENIVPHLTLRGIALATLRALDPEAVETEQEGR